jgi:hypothetical protein
MHIDYLKSTFYFTTKHSFLNLKFTYLFDAKWQEMERNWVWGGYAEYDGTG